MTRRKLLFDSYLGLGGLALMDLLAADSAQASTERAPHHPCKAKNCIFLFMEGGVSQMDTFEYKPALVKYAGKQMPKATRTTGELATFSSAPNRVIPPYWQFKQHGQSGRWMSSLLPNLATRVDEIAFIHGLKVDNNTHGPAVYPSLPGNLVPPSAPPGAWGTSALPREQKETPRLRGMSAAAAATIP